MIYLNVETHIYFSYLIRSVIDPHNIFWSRCGQYAWSGSDLAMHIAMFGTGCLQSMTHGGSFLWCSHESCWHDDWNVAFLSQSCSILNLYSFNLSIYHMKSRAVLLYFFCINYVFIYVFVFVRSLIYSSGK